MDTLEDVAVRAAPIRDNAPFAACVPLCVDLDGTLVRSDMLVEGVLQSAVAMRLHRVLSSLRAGRAAFKQAVAAQTTFDPALLPYNAGLLAYLRGQKAGGRRLVLVTAADASVAHAIAAHLRLFDEVIASDGERNLKGAAKAAVLVERFGSAGFAYAGDSRDDLHVWRVAHSGILVNPSRTVAGAARSLAPIEAEFSDRPPLWRGLLQAMRPHQWLKNLLVFVPLLVAGHAITGAHVMPALLAFAAFSLTASGIYLFNDLMDLAADRAHPRKRRRPFASGDVPVQAGLAAGAGLVASGVLLAALAGILPIVALYVLLSTAYSARLKELALVDVFVLAGLYSVRLVGGGEATGDRVSLWLLAFSSFLFLSLALVKRVGELQGVPAGKDGTLARRGYQPGDVAILQAFGCGAATAASLVLALFVQYEGMAGRYSAPELLWGVVPLVLFWQSRVWLATARGNMHDDPIVFAARDRVSWVVAGLSLALMLGARSLELGW